LQKGLIFTGSFKTVVSRNTAVTFLLIIAGNIFAALSRVNQNLSGFDVVWQFFLFKRMIFFNERTVRLQIKCMNFPGIWCV
jgi:hypothetical protein